MATTRINQEMSEATEAVKTQRKNIEKSVGFIDHIQKFVKY